MFRLEIAKGLAAEWEARGCSNIFERNVTPTEKFAVRTSQIRIHLRGAVNLEGRFDSVDGHASFFAKLPELAGSEKKPMKRRDGTTVWPSHRTLYCRYCVEILKLEKPSRTSFWCKKCEKPLCKFKGLCFQKWHSMASKNETNMS
jgi:hypothetical protein